MNTSLLAPLIVSLLAGRLSNQLADDLLANGNTPTTGLCPKCKTLLPGIAELPIFGPLAVCPRCNTRRPIQGVVELLCVIWSMAAYILCPNAWLEDVFISAIALVLFRTDWEDMVLYDASQLALVSGALFFRGPRLGLEATFEIVIWAISAGLAVWCFGKVYKAVKGFSGIGDGDPLLVGTLSLWLSPLSIPILLACAPLAAVIWGLLTKKEMVPIGAFLSLFAPMILLMESLY